MSHWKEKILNGGLVGTFVKYRYFILCKDNYRKKYLVHKLVYENFKETVPNGLTIDHIDSDPLNNRLDNLQVVTYSVNNLKASKSAHKKKHSYKVIDIYTDEEFIFKTAKEGAKYFDVNSTYFRNISIKKCTSNYLKGRYKIEEIELIA